MVHVLCDVKTQLPSDTLRSPTVLQQCASLLHHDSVLAASDWCKCGDLQAPSAGVQVRMTKRIFGPANVKTLQKGSILFNL